jgi:subtilisin family serine protease
MRTHIYTTIVIIGALTLGACQSNFETETIDVSDNWKGIAEVNRSRWFDEINAGGVLKDKKLTGKGVTITIMGEMVDGEHPDLQNIPMKQYNAWSYKGYIRAGEGNRPYGADLLSANDGHGTHIAGIIAAACDGVAIQGLACRSKLDVYDLGAYDSTAKWPTRGWVGIHDFERFLSSFTRALRDVTDKQSSKILTGSFNLESPAIFYNENSGLFGKSVTDLIQVVENEADDIKDLAGKGYVQFQTPSDLEYLKDMIAKNDGDSSIALLSILPLSRQWLELEAAIVHYQNAGGVYLVTESNYNFEGRSSTLNAFPSLSDKIDKDLWLSVVMVQPKELETSFAADYEGDITKLLADKSYSFPLNSCGELASEYCILTPSWNVFSTMTKRVAFDDGSPLLTLDGRVHQIASGHSMGAPMVAATLALMEEENQKNNLGYSMKKLVKILKESANRSFPGYNAKTHGRGLLDVGAAIAAMQE